MKFICKQVEDAHELEEAYLVRKKVFIDEQDVPEELERDEFDDAALHVICKADELVIAAGRILLFDEEAIVGRVAVLKPWRYKGIGRKIMEFIMDIAKNNGVKTLAANVQIDAQDFYEKLGFKPVGELFLEAGREHIKMICDLHHAAV
jgi:predicted GNAT family N-acyltransferase